MRYWFRCLTTEYSWVKRDKLIAIMVFSGFWWHMSQLCHEVLKMRLCYRKYMFSRSNTPRASGNGTLGITPEERPVWILLPSDLPLLFLFLSVFMQTSGHPKLSSISSVWAGPSNNFVIEISFMRKSLVLYKSVSHAAIILQYAHIKIILLKLWFFKASRRTVTQKRMTNKFYKNKKHYEHSSGCFNFLWAPN